MSSWDAETRVDVQRVTRLPTASSLKVPHGAFSGMPVCGMESRQRPDNLPMPKIDARTRYLHILNKFVMVWNSPACAEPPVYVFRPVRHTCPDEHGPLMECTRVLSGRRAPGQTLEGYRSIYI
jgi:hypothetical protein